MKTFLILLACIYLVNADYSLCKLVDKTNVHVERGLVGDGFHRSLTSSFVINTSVNLNSCYILIKESIPNGAYCDPYELKFLWEFIVNSFYIPEFVNTESPEHLSSNMKTYIFAKPDYQEMDAYIYNISLPIHLRYHRAKKGSEEPLEERVIFPHPALYVYCDNEVLEEECTSHSKLEPCPASGVHKCIWFPVNSFSTTDYVEAVVPVGNLDLGETVLLTTTAITFGAVLLLLQSLARNSLSFSHKSIT